MNVHDGVYIDVGCIVNDIDKPRFSALIRLEYYLWNYLVRKRRADRILVGFMVQYEKQRGRFVNFDSAVEKNDWMNWQKVIIHAEILNVVINSR